MQMNQFLKVKDSLLELEEKDFTELRDREVIDREVKIKRDIETLFLNRLLCVYR